MAKNTSKKQYSNKAFRPARGETSRVAVSDESTKYADPSRKKENYETLHTTAEKFAPNKDKPTTAAGKKGQLNLPSVLAAVDPNGISSIAPMMYQMLGQIQSSSSGSSQSSRKKIIEDSFSGALAILSNKYTFNKLTFVFYNALKDDKIKLIDIEYRQIVKNALANLYMNYIQYGEGKLPVSVYDTVTKIGSAPSPVVTTVPDLYVQQYYTKETDPTPGYKKWVSPDKTKTVYTVRKIGERYYTSASEELYSIAEQELAAAIDPYIPNNTLTAKILNNLLETQDGEVEKNSQNLSSGKNSSNKTMGILMQLAGYAGTIANLQQKVHLPLSILNKSEITKSHEKFMKNIGQLKQEKEKAKQAAQPLSAVSSLVSSVTSSTISKLPSSAQNLYNTIKS